MFCSWNWVKDEIDLHETSSSNLFSSYVESLTFQKFRGCGWRDQPQQGCEKSQCRINKC